MPAPTSPAGVIFALTNSTADMVSIQLLKDYGQPDSIVVLIEPQQTVSLVLNSGVVYRYAARKECEVLDIVVKLWHDLEWDVFQLYDETPRAFTDVRRLEGVHVERSWHDFRQFIASNRQHTMRPAHPRMPQRPHSS